MKVFVLELENGIIHTFYAKDYNEAVEVAYFYATKILRYHEDYDVYEVKRV